MKPTKIAWPYALVKRGGQSLGKRKPTQLAVLVRQTGNDYYGRIITAAGRVSKTLRFIALESIVICWGHMPTKREIQNARKTNEDINRQ